MGSAGKSWWSTKTGTSTTRTSTRVTFAPTATAACSVVYSMGGPLLSPQQQRTRCLEGKLSKCPSAWMHQSQCTNSRVAMHQQPCCNAPTAVSQCTNSRVAMFQPPGRNAPTTWSQCSSILVGMHPLMIGMPHFGGNEL